MNWLINYTNFERDVLATFGRLASEFKMNLEMVSEGAFTLNSGTCLVNIFSDRGTVYCLISDPRDKESQYNIVGLYNYFYPDAKSLDAKGQSDLEVFEKILREDLSFVLNGDFTWVSEYQHKTDENRRLFAYLTNRLDRAHPIFLKYKNGDPSWRGDLIEYIKYHK